MSARERLEKLLQENHVPFEEHQHLVAYTAKEAAQVDHVPGKMFAKVTMARLKEDEQSDDGLVMLVLNANERVDFKKLRNIVGRPVHLANEREFEAAFPDCEVGAMPPFGNLYGLPTYVEKTLTEDEEIVFNAGTHTDAMKMRFADYQRLAQPVVAEFAQ